MFEGKVAIVTGGASGIGFATAKKLILKGATVVICDINDNIEDIASYLGNRCYGIKCDVSKEDDVKLVVETTLKNYHKIDFLVANAGIGGSANKPHELSFEDYNKVISVNQNGIFLFNKYDASFFINKTYSSAIKENSKYNITYKFNLI